MTRLPLIPRCARAGLLMGLAACLALLWFAAAVPAAGAAATTASWSPVALPWSGSWAVYDVCAVGKTGLAATGDGGHIAVTRDAGGSWQVVVPQGLEGTVFTAVALGTTGNGAVASGGRLLVTSDGGGTWRTPAYVGPAPGAAINDIALRGSQFVAVGDDGVIMSSDDSGSTWRRTDSPTANALTCVAIAGDGTVVAGSSAGEILVGSGGGWALAGTVTGAVTSVAASADPVWGDGRPDLIAATGGDVLGSDDARTFASLPGLPDPSSRPWSTVAWTGVPERSLLIAGAQRAGFFGTVDHQWVAGLSGLGAGTCAVAPAGQSIAYLLGADGSLVRTLSAGREPAAASLAETRIVVGATTRLTATVRVGAPGSVGGGGGGARAALRRPPPIPGRSWVTERAVAWTAADWERSLSFSVSPSLTHEYSLEFQYGGVTTQLAPAAKLVVEPKVGTARARYVLHVGDVFRFSGSVAPQLPGTRVELFTDRGGGWRPVSLQRSVTLHDGRTWTSRQFGTPKAETYRLRAHLTSTKTHAEAWSRVVTVAIH